MENFDILQVNLIIEEETGLGVAFSRTEKKLDIPETVSIGNPNMHLTGDNELMLFNVIALRKDYFNKVSVESLSNIIDECIARLVETIKQTAENLKLENCLNGNKINIMMGKLYYKVKEIVDNDVVMGALFELLNQDKEQMATTILHSV